MGAGSCNAGFESKLVKNKGAECMTATQLLLRKRCDGCMSSDDMFCTAFATERGSTIILLCKSLLIISN